METVLVTGASGLLGSRIIRMLGQTGKYDIVAVSSSKKTRDPGGYSGRSLTC